MFNGRGRYTAKVGATAIVEKLGKEYFFVKWVRDSLSGSQANGEYFYSNFKPVLKPGEQMEFSFMCEG